MEILKAKILQEAWESLKNNLIKAQTQTVPERKKNERQLMRPASFQKMLSYKLRNTKDNFKKWNKRLYNETRIQPKDGVRKAKTENELRLVMNAKIIITTTKRLL